MRDYAFNDETMYVGADGYPRFKDTDMLVHRWVMSKKTGRRLDSNEIVHHIDGDKMNFQPDNLEIFSSQNKHEAHHKRMKTETGDWHGRGIDIGWFLDLVSTVVGFVGKYSIIQGILFFIIGTVIGYVLHVIYPQWDLTTISCGTVCFPLIILFVILITSIRKKWDLYGKNWATIGVIMLPCGAIVSIMSSANPIVSFLGGCVIFAGLIFAFAQDRG